VCINQGSALSRLLFISSRSLFKEVQCGFTMGAALPPYAYHSIAETKEDMLEIEMLDGSNKVERAKG
jgi:hypothetical protein